MAKNKVTLKILKVFLIFLQKIIQNVSKTIGFKTMYIVQLSMKIRDTIGI